VRAVAFVDLLFSLYSSQEDLTRLQKSSCQPVYVKPHAASASSSRTVRTGAHGL